MRGDTVHMLPPELDVSGGRPLTGRPGLLEAVVGVETGRFGGLAVAYLSRMGRELRTMLEAWDRIEHAGGRVLVVREQIDTGTPAGRLHRNLLAAIDVSQREQAAEAFEERRRVATEQGIWKQPQTPVGYRRDPVTRRLVPDPATSSMVRRAFRARAAGDPVVEIARMLGMTAAGTRRMLSNRVYLGELRQGTHVNLLAHPALIDVELFDACQSRSRPASTSHGRPPALLAGLVRCEWCGHTMSRSFNGGGRWASYLCRKHHSGFSCEQPAAISTRLLDQHVESVIRGYLHGLQATGTPADVDNTLTGRIEQAERELAAYLTGVTAAGIPPQVFADGLAARQSAIDRLRAEHAATIGTQRALQIDLDRFWQDATMLERNHLLGGLLDVVIIKAGRGPVADRARLIRNSSGIRLPVRVPGQRLGRCRLLFPGLDDPMVVRESGG